MSWCKHSTHATWQISGSVEVPATPAGHENANIGWIAFTVARPFHRDISQAFLSRKLIYFLKSKLVVFLANLWQHDCLHCMTIVFKVFVFLTLWLWAVAHSEVQIRCYLVWKQLGHLINIYVDIQSWQRTCSFNGLFFKSVHFKLWCLSWFCYFHSSTC